VLDLESANASPIVSGLNATARPNIELALRKQRRDLSSDSFIARNGRITSACSPPRCVALDWVIILSSFAVFISAYVLRVLLTSVGQSRNGGQRKRKEAANVLSWCFFF
jgi:hypothetical protein